MEVLLGVQVLHCEEERERDTRRLSRVTQTETCFRRRPPRQEAFRFPQEPQHQAGVPTPSDLSILICFGVVYCLLGHTASTSGRTFKEDLTSPKGRFRKDPRGHESRISTGALLHCDAPLCPAGPRALDHLLASSSGQLQPQAAPRSSG